MRETRKIISGQLFISMLLFCAVIVLMTVSPLAQYGRQANQLGSIGMWAAISLTIIGYGVLLLFNRLKGRLFRLFLAISVGLAALIDVSLIVAYALSSYFMESYHWASLTAIGIQLVAVISKAIILRCLTKKRKPETSANTTFIYKS